MGTCQSQYRLDQTGRVLGPDQWWRNRHTQGVDDKIVGTVIPGIDKICAKAVAMHKVVLKLHPTRFLVSWDAMLTEDGGVVWFEGNTSALRLNRPLWSSWAFLLAFVQNYSWPMR